MAPESTGDLQTQKPAPTRLKDAAEEELEKLVFGDLTGFQAGLHADRDGDYSSEDDNEVRLSFNRALGDVEQMEDDQVDSGSTKPTDLVPATSTDLVKVDGSDSESETGKPAWEDSDDERLTISLSTNPRLRKLRTTELDDVITGTEYTKRLRIQYERINPIPDWSLPQKDSERPKKSRRTLRQSQSPEASSDEEDEVMDIDLPTNNSLATLLQSSSTYTKRSKVGKLPPETLDISRLRDANYLAPSHSGIQSLSFHKTHPLLLSAGFDHVLRLYHIDKKTNPPATSLYLQGTPIHTAAFHPDGKRVIAGGRRRYFHIWDLESGKVEKITRIYGNQEHQKSMEKFKLSPCGRFMALCGAHGYVNILDAKTGQWVSSVVVEGVVADISWSIGGKTLFVANKGGEIWEWSSSERKIESRWVDEGGVGLTTISLGGNDRWCAVGSQSGVVNIYDRKEKVKVEGHPTPKRALGNLVTGINVLEFSDDGQLLCMGSKDKRDALRMVHLPTCTVFKNWPTTSTPVGSIMCASFAGSASGLFAFGNQQGKVRLWEIR
ncbi:hypothetical protein H072_1955 [Dactylellina haptotyla CBS 200.50]|uniref:Anaphase-promoting complex subunit 4-like WD40 domain-containing protein n=1 Tax=Dactylellina haptotyla (strain CBS 200.50) TaxID=1284197 RepID=S8AMH2_DACHA|nr:hypothetical protein H072_1955 [Dactylellina haptotyla CBS 200.50]